MPKNLTIAGATYPNVPAIVLRTSDGGTARFVDEDDTSSSTGGGLPDGISAIKIGEYEVSTDFTTSRQTVTHGLGVVPDMILFWKDGENIAQANTMMWALRSTRMGYRSSAYNLWCGYHGNNTTQVSLLNSNSTTYGVSNMTATTFQLASVSSSYYWRKGIYKWMAIKF